MSRTKLIIGGVVVIILIAAIGASAGSKNTPAGSVATSAPSASAVAQAAGATSAPSTAVASAVPPTAASSSTPAGTYKVGDRVKLGEEEFFAISQVDPAFKGTDLMKPAAGKRWVAALVEIEGINPNGAAYNPFFFKVRDDQGFEYNYNAFGKEPMLQSSNELKPGQKIKGWMTFEVPDTAKTLTLVYAAGVGGEPVEVTLT